MNLKIFFLNNRAALLIGITLLAFKASGQVSQTYSTPGSYTFTVPAAVTTITVEAWGGGGGGGGSSINNSGGSGGGGGGYALINLAVTAGQTVNIVVGNGGAAGAPAGGNGGNGGNTEVTYDLTTISANGGSGGNGNSGNAGQGGTAAGGFTNLTGNNGIQGGASGGDGGDGANGGAGGSGNTNSAGSSGNEPGGGGGGGERAAGGSRAGGAGANGRVVVSWTGGIYTSNGTFTIPADISTVMVEAWGGGGAGGAATGNPAAGGGGAGGSYARSVISVNPGNYPVVIGAGGTGSGGAGQAGGGSYFISNVTILAQGGAGGALASSNSSNGARGLGSSSSSIGEVVFAGGDGSNGNYTSGVPGGAGGGGAGSGSDGNDAAAGIGGAANGYGGAGANGVNNSTPGTNGFVYGGGGSGGKANSGTNRNGGSGASGLVLIWAPTVYYSQGSGDPNVLSNWRTSTGLPATSFTADHQNFIIRNGHTMSTTGIWSVSGLNSAVRIQNGGTLVGNHSIALSANTFFLIDNNGTYIHNVNSNLIFDGKEIFANSSNVVYGYNGNQSIADIPYGNLIISGSGTKTLLSNLAIGNNLTMNGGDIFTGSHTVVLTNNSPAALSHSSGRITGKIRRAVITTSSDYLFPVGTSAHYRPAVFNFTTLGSSTDITAEFIGTSPPGFVSYTDGNSNLDALFTEGFWRFSSSSTPAANYSVILDGAGFTSHTLDQGSRLSFRDNTNNTWRAAGSHGTLAGNILSRTNVTTLNNTWFEFAFARGCILTSLGYQYERTITIDHTKVAGGVNLFSFPVLISLTGQNYLRNVPAGRISHAGGYDIIFTDNNYNQLDHQIEYFNGTNGDLIAWVRIPVLSTTANTVIKMLYGNSEVTTNPSVTSVWDSHYRGVWHFNDNGLADFTSYNKAATPYNTPSYPAGMINNSLGLDEASSEYAIVSGAPNLNFAGNITVSAWVRMDTRTRDQKIAGNQNGSSGGFKFGIYTNNRVEFEIRNSSNTPSLNRDVTGGTELFTNQWYYLAGVSSDVLDSIKTFVNGVSERPFKKTGILGLSSNNLTIGKEPFENNYYFDGRFDELRISDKVRSDGWLRTEYNNQFSPSTFYAVSGESASNNLPSESLCSGPITLNFGSPAGGIYSGDPHISGNIFTPEDPGTYTIVYTIPGQCGGVSKNFIITPKPDPPSAENQVYCTGQIAYLSATSGENIRWYYGGSLVSTANPFSTGQTAQGTYNYTVTQTLNGCESDPTSVSLTISNSIYSWTGNSGTSWNSASNWSCSTVPASVNSVVIPNVTNMPIIGAGIEASVNNITITPGASLTVNGTLKISGSLTTNAGLDAANGKIEMNGSSAQVIPANSFNGNIIKDLTVNNPAGVSLSGPASLHGILLLQNGNLSSNGNLTLCSDVSGTALINGTGTGNVTGNVTMQRYLSNSFGYKYFSSPFQGATIEEFGNEVDLLYWFPLIWAFDENRNYLGTPLDPFYSYNDPGNVLNPGEGYAVNFGADPDETTVDLTGVVNNGFISRTLYNHNHLYAAGRNMVGNPYPSPIDWTSAQGWTKTNIDNALYFFKSGGVDEWEGEYSSWINGVSSDGIVSNIIPSMQGFLVHVSDGAYPVTGTLAMDNRVRITGPDQVFSKKSAGTGSDKPLIRLSASFTDQDPGADLLVIYFDEKATPDFDTDCDALKFNNTDHTIPNFWSYAQDGSRLSINGLPLPDGTAQIVPLGYSSDFDGEVTFRLKKVEGPFSWKTISFFDSQTGDKVDLRSGGEYTVTLPSGEYSDRFFLNIDDLTTSAGSSEKPDDPFRVYSSHGLIYADIFVTNGYQGRLTIHDLTGKVLYNEEIHSSGKYEIDPGLNDGIYIVSYISGNLRISEKVIIKN